MSNERGLQRLLAAIGETRGDDFEMFTDLADVGKSLADDKIIPPDVAQWVRMFKILNIAYTETARIEAETFGREPALIVVELCRITGECCAMLLAQIVTPEGLRSDVPDMLLAHIMDGFRTALEKCKEMT